MSVITIFSVLLLRVPTFAYNFHSFMQMIIKCPIEKICILKILNNGVIRHELITQACSFHTMINNYLDIYHSWPVLEESTTQEKISPGQFKWYREVKSAVPVFREGYLRSWKWLRNTNNPGKHLRTTILYWFYNDQMQRAGHLS